MPLGKSIVNHGACTMDSGVFQLFAANSSPGIGRDLRECWNWNSTVHRLFCEPFSNERNILKGGSGCHQRWRVFLVLKVTNMTKPTPQNPPNQPGVVFFFSCGWLMIGFTSLSPLWLQKRRHREKPPAFRWGCRRSGR